MERIYLCLKNIDLKESDYKGSKVVTKMRKVIKNRKIDFNLNNNNNNNLI